MRPAPGPRHPRRSGRPPAPPVAAVRPKESVVHGVTLRDDYDWLRAPNWKEVLRHPEALPADISTYLEAENAYCKAMMSTTRGLQRELLGEMRGRIKEDDSSVPQPDGDWLYYSRYRKGAEHPLICRRPRDGQGKNKTKSREQVMLDADALAEGKDFFDLGGTAHSPDHRLLAWSADEAGSELHRIRVRDLETGEDLADAVEDTTGEIVWARDARSFFYVALDADHRPSRVLRHRLGTAAATDELLHDEADAGMFVDIDKSQSGRFLTISISDHETSEVRLLDLDVAGAAVTLVAARQPGRQYSLEHHGEDFLILTNADGAEDFKIVTAPLGDPAPAQWRDLVPHRQGRLILDHVCLRGRLIRLEREDGLPRITIHDLRTGAESSIAFDEEAYSLGLQGAAEYDTDIIRFSYSSMTTPTQLFDYNMATRERTLLKTQEVPSGHNPDDYVTRRVFAPAWDGESVPVTLLYRKDLVLDGTAPCLLYGYGAYGITIPASFNTSCLSLVDRGFVYAIAHIRGGKDKGFAWYENGKMQNKENTFKDFVAAADYLAAEKYTSYGRIVAEGGSAGGMLMGAVANMAPEKFAAFIAAVPFVDVLNTMLDDTLPLTPPEWPEWGNPIDSEEEYGWIAAYSPYENVDARPYPPILALAGLTDPRVTYWEPAKWVARLREKTTGDQPILLRTNMDAGHGGASGRFQRLEEVAFEYAFAIKVAGKM